jgi:hypothetical protein
LSEMKMSEPVLRFATGILKGRPLESAGVYRIVMFQGKEVAQFNDGSKAFFYRDAPEATGSSGAMLDDLVCTEDGAGEWGPSYLKAIDAGPQMEICEPKPKRIAVYKTKDGERPKHPCDPIYCVLDGGHVAENFDRQVVGFGVREYLWLYERFRSFGRGWFAAAWEALGIYFL